MNALVPVIIFIVLFIFLYLVGKWQQGRRQYGLLILKAVSEAQMDAMKLEIGERLLPACETFWQDVTVLTKENL